MYSDTVRYSVAGSGFRVASLVIAMVSVISGSAGVVHADGRQRAPRQEALDDQQAKHLFFAGEAAFAAGRLEEALALFTQAYEHSGRPELLFNIGSVAERLRDDQRALDAYEAYLTAVPDAVNRSFVERR